MINVFNLAFASNQIGIALGHFEICSLLFCLLLFIELSKLFAYSSYIKFKKKNKSDIENNHISFHFIKKFIHYIIPSLLLQLVLLGLISFANSWMLATLIYLCVNNICLRKHYNRSAANVVILIIGRCCAAPQIKREYLKLAKCAFDTILIQFLIRGENSSPSYENVY